MTLLNSWIDAGVARCPRAARAAPPGTTCSSRNTSRVTPKTTTAAWTTRRARYPITVGGYFVKYHSSGVMLSNVFCGITPCRFFWISVSA